MAQVVLSYRLRRSPGITSSLSANVPESSPSIVKLATGVRSARPRVVAMRAVMLFEDYPSHSR